MSNPWKIRMYTRARSRRRMLDVDLNAAPPCEIRDQGVVSHHTRSQDRQEAGRSGTMPPPIDVEELADDVIISSPTTFVEMRGHPATQRRRFLANQTIINCDLYINLESSSNSMRKSGQIATVPPIHLVPPKEPTFSCPVCMGPLVEAMSTKYGYIFYKACIKASIAAQGKCVTCRRKTTMKDIIRVYLPSTRSA